MRASEWIVQQCSIAKRKGFCYGLVVGYVAGFVFVACFHVITADRAENKHAEAVAVLTAEHRRATSKLKDDLARYQEIAAVEKAYAERRPSGD